jgi:tetratricopeptide (TPR) repeat protein
MPKMRLDSWKSIAKYLERSPRTVQRWHACNALPVHHLGGAKGSVFAFAEEIDEWLIGVRDEPEGLPASADVALEGKHDHSLELTSRAQQMWEARSEQNLNAIILLYRKAIDHNPANAPALTGLANAMILAVLQGVMESAIAFPGALEALRLARQIDTHDPQAQCCEAWLDLMHEHRWLQARRGFEWVLKHQPRCSFAMGGMALLMVAEGDPACASEWAWRAWQNNVLVPALGALVCWCQYLAGEANSALEWLGQVRMTGGGGAFIAIIESLALVETGEPAATIERIEVLAAEFPNDRVLQGILGHAYAIDGQLNRARRLMDTLRNGGPQNTRNSAYGIALIHLGLGDGQAALRWLENAFEDGSLWSFGFGSDPILAHLRGEPRFESLLSRIGTGQPIHRAGALKLVAQAM